MFINNFDKKILAVWLLDWDFLTAPVCLKNVFDCNIPLTAHARENVLLDCIMFKVNKSDKKPKHDITTIRLLMMW